MKINERGRAKFRPDSKIALDDIQLILKSKIDTEQDYALKNGVDLDITKLSYEEKKLNMISLFSGCGGLDLGAEVAGLDVLYGKEFVNSALNCKSKYNELRSQSLVHTILTVDNFKEANATYKMNFPNHVLQCDSDIRKIKSFPKADIVIGGFPCPGFSEAGPRLIDDDRNFLYVHFIRCLTQSNPMFFIAENVKGMLTLGKGAVVQQIKEDFISAGYRVKVKLLNARDFGIPQIRERVFLVGVREDIDFEYYFPEPTHGINDDLIPFTTLEDAIGDLLNAPGDYYKGSFSSIYLSRNRKKLWNEQSFTIQASGRQAPLHPDGKPMVNISKDLWDLPGGEDMHRRLSVKEIARIQTFPDFFEFSVGENSGGSDNNKINYIYKQIGNAVPVNLSRAVLNPIVSYYNSKLQNK